MNTTYVTTPFLQGDYTILKKWYQNPLSRQPNPLRADLEKVSGEYAALYQQEDRSPPGRLFLTHIYQLQIDNRVLAEAELEASVRWLRLKG